MDLHILLILAMIGLFVGLAKTAISGFGLLAVTLCVSIIPARESTGVMLMLLLVGDLFAIRIYKNFVEWKFIRSLLVPVAFGICIGAVFLAQSTDLELKKFIGWLVFVLVGTFVMSKLFPLSSKSMNLRLTHILGSILGTMSGFMSAVANAGGTPMSIYLFLRKNEKKIFMGNSAWFFFIVNLSKVPIVFFLNLLHLTYIRYLIIPLPFIFLGAFLGKRVLEKIDQNLFQNVTLFSSFLVGLRLIFS